MSNSGCHLHDDWDTLNRTISRPDFQGFVRAAYRNPSGYAIRINPLTKRKEMFIAGTKTATDWFLNVWDLFKYDPFRKQKEYSYAKIAEANSVHIVYGHSRGGAIVADMPLNRCTQRVGLSSAMVIANNKCMLNLNEGGGSLTSDNFDKIIGMTGRNNRTIDYSPQTKNFHKVWAVNQH